MNKIIDKIITVIVVVLFIVGFREMILTDELADAAFGELIGLLPFAKELSDPISTVLKCQYEVPVISTASVGESLLRLAVMACIQPLVMWLLTKVLLPLSAELTNIGQREDYMDSFSYKLKEVLINIICCPLLAVGAAWLSTHIIGFLTSALGNIWGILAGIGGIVLGLGLSVWVLMWLGNLTAGVAIMWRLLITVLPKLLEVFVTDVLCIALYFAVVGGVRSQIFWSAFALILWIVICVVGMELIMQSVAGINLKRGTR